MISNVSGPGRGGIGAGVAPKFSKLAAIAQGVLFALGCAALCALAQFARAGEEPRALAPAGYFHIFKLDKQTYAISEPKYWMENVSYLLLGTHQALLFDTGPGIYSIKAVVRSITPLPVLVIPSHLHLDHIGDLQEFDDVRLLDTPALRAQVHDGYFVEPPEQSLLLTSKPYRVNGWIADGETIELGGRAIKLLSTPGHTPDSVSLIDASHKRMFTGDIVNRMVTLVDVPGSDVSAMAASLHRLLELGPAGAPAYEAHAEIPIQPAELKMLAAGVAEIAAGHATSKPMCEGNVPMLRYDVGAFPFVLPTASGVTLPPFRSMAETLDWLAPPCAGVK
jgi:glyoxylase-like metal-dependent hydrolase (beta-lactamase superfamily II)